MFRLAAMGSKPAAQAWNAARTNSRSKAKPNRAKYSLLRSLVLHSKFAGHPAWALSSGERLRMWNLTVMELEWHSSASGSGKRLSRTTSN